jgi:hypothetical protein
VSRVYKDSADQNEGFQISHLVEEMHTNVGLLHLLCSSPLVQAREAFCFKNSAQAEQEESYRLHIKQGTGHLPIPNPHDSCEPLKTRN